MLAGFSSKVLAPAVALDGGATGAGAAGAGAAGAGAVVAGAVPAAALTAAAESALETGFPFLSMTFTGAPESWAFLMHALSVIAHVTALATLSIASSSLRFTSELTRCLILPKTPWDRAGAAMSTSAVSAPVII